MLIGTSEAVLQVLSGTAPRLYCYDPCFGKSDSTIPSITYIKCMKKRAPRYLKLINCSSKRQSLIKTFWFQDKNGSLYRDTVVDRLRTFSCNSQRAESVSGITAEDGNGTWYVDSSKKLNSINGGVDTPNVLDFKQVEQLEQKKDFPSNGNSLSVDTVRDTLHKVSVDHLEEEAWDLLRESMVYYCGSPVGTIAAKDPTSSNVLNYDQVFLRDFIPSGIAFLLKGEYDIVRNFILHTLQLQVCDDTQYPIYLITETN